MDKGKASLIGEETLWQLYRRLLAATFLDERLRAHQASRSRSMISPAVAAALTENLLEGDTLGLAPSDLVTRYLFGMPLPVLSKAALEARTLHQRRPSGPHWSFAPDQDYCILPGDGSQQADLALGVALGTRLHSGSSIAVLVQGSSVSRRPGTSPTMLPGWIEAARAAVSLQLPLLLVTDSAAGLSRQRPQPNQPPPSLPAIPVDRDDSVALYRVIYESVTRARAGGGPTWIDCRDARLVSSAKHPPAEPQPTPLARMEQALRARKCFTRERQRHTQRALARELAAAGWPSGEQP